MQSLEELARKHPDSRQALIAFTEHVWSELTRRALTYRAAKQPEIAEVLIDAAMSFRAHGLFPHLPSSDS